MNAEMDISKNQWRSTGEKYALAVPKNLRVVVDFRPCIEGDFLTGRP